MLSIKATLRTVLSPAPPAQDVREFVNLCHRMATINLQSRVARGGVRLDLLGLSVNDLALDCIAPLFTRDDENRFPKLQRYFNELDWESATDAALLARLRSLIFRIAQQELSRLYQSADPSLGRIIENLHYAIEHSPEFGIRERFGHPWIVFRAYQGNDLPEMPGEFLEAHLSARLSGGCSLRDTLQELSVILTENDAYYPGYPLVDFALRVRSCVVRAHPGRVTDPGHDPHALSRDEIADAVDLATTALAREYRTSYCDRDAMTDEQFDALLAAVGSILRAEYLDHQGDPRSFYDHFHAVFPALDHALYRNIWRSRLEYLVKLGRKRLLKSLRTEFL